MEGIRPGRSDKRQYGPEIASPRPHSQRKVKQQGPEPDWEAHLEKLRQR